MCGKQGVLVLLMGLCLEIKFMHGYAWGVLYVFDGLKIVVGFVVSTISICLVYLMVGGRSKVVEMRNYIGATFANGKW